MFGLENPFVYLLELGANVLGGNVGVAIIALTILIRLFLLPLFMKQEKQGEETKVKIKALQPELAGIQEKISKAKTQEEQFKHQLEVFQVYKKNGINPKSMGLLPAILQAPIFMGFYHALTGAGVLHGHSFLWFELSRVDLFVALLVGLCYFVDASLNKKVNPPTSEKNPLQGMYCVFPVIMMIVSMTLPSGIGLYWITGVLFMMSYKSLKLAKTRN